MYSQDSNLIDLMAYLHFFELIIFINQFPIFQAFFISKILNIYLTSIFNSCNSVSVKR